MRSILCAVTFTSIIKPVPRGLSSHTTAQSFSFQLDELSTLSELVNTFEVAGDVDLMSDSVWPAEMPFVY